MEAKKKNTLPHDWRIQTSRILATQGCELNTQQVYDVFRGRIANPELVAKVTEAMAIVKSQYRRQLRMANRLQKMAAFFLINFWLA